SGNTLISTAGGNTLEVDDTSTRITSGTNSLTVDATTGTSINGNLTVNGTITTFNPIANSGITNGNNSVLISGANNEISITADDNANTTDGRGNISISNTQATVTVTNSSGNTHGLTVSETETELSGGSNSTTITLDDNGATFSDSVTSGPVKVTGVANGVDHFDAVNRSQLNGVATRAYSGIASVAALAAIPEPIPGKRYSLGVGLGHYAGEEALAIGFKSNIGNSMRFSTAIGRSHGNTTTNAGLGFSW
ncbi:MAG: YadA C-terminal domain-containing protein, partial [Sedimenticola sp.]